jgi:hypothetical protein
MPNFGINTPKIGMTAQNGTRVAAEHSVKPDLGSPGEAPGFELAGNPSRSRHPMNTRLRKGEHDVLLLPVAVRPLTCFGRLSEFRRSSKSCQRPDSAAGEIPHTPCRLPKPARVIGLPSGIAEAADCGGCFSKPVKGRIATSYRSQLSAAPWTQSVRHQIRRTPCRWRMALLQKA